MEMVAAMLAAAKQALPYGTAIREVQVVPCEGRAAVLHVLLNDESTRTCVAKRAGPREMRLYQSLLTSKQTGAPALLGACAAVDGPGGWLFLERLTGTFVDTRQWEQTAVAYAHLGDVHRRFAAPARPGPVPAFDPSPASVAAALGRHVPEQVAERAASLLAAGPVTLIHGDYHRWNIFYYRNPCHVRVVDWEHAGFAHPVWDLVLLTPEEPAWDGVPRGQLSLAALCKYHQTGPLWAMPAEHFLWLQTAARLYTAACWADRHARRAEKARRGSPPAIPESIDSAHAPRSPAGVIAAEAQVARARTAFLATRLTDWPM